jgi:hypothetical protein
MLLKEYKPAKEIDFSLFVPDYMEMFEVFNQTPQCPFNLDDESHKIDVSNVHEHGPSTSNDRSKGGRGGAKGVKPSRAVDHDPEHEADPDWIEFDPEKDRSKFFGHVMEDEGQLRSKVVEQKEKKNAREAERKQRAIENAKKAALTAEQQELVGRKESAEDIMTKLDQQKLKEAQAIIAQIESESYSRFDVDYESKNKGGYHRNEEEILTDD